MIMGFSDSSSGGLEEHNAWNPMLVDEKELERIALSRHLVLDIQSDKSETRRAQKYSLGHHCSRRKPPQAFT